MGAAKEMMTVLLLDPQPRFLHRLSEEFGRTAQAYGQQCRVVSVDSSEAALKELGRQSLSYWDMFLVNQDFLRNGTSWKDSPPLVEALRGRFAHTPVAILCSDKVVEADGSYKGLRMPRLGRPGYTTYIFREPLFVAPAENGHPIQQSVQETTCDDVYHVVRARRLMAQILRRQGWLEKLVRSGEIDVGISIVDYTYRLHYVNAQQRRISCRRDIQIGGVCWMEYDPDFGLVHHCPWCPVAKARAARRPRSSTTISPSHCPYAVVPGSYQQADLGLLAYRFYDVRAVPIPDPMEPGASGRSAPSTDTAFLACDLRSPPSFLKRLREPDPLAEYLWGRFSETARTALSDPEVSRETMGEILAAELNVVLEDSPIYDAGRFKNVDLSDGTRRLLETHDTTELAVEVNRRLLEDAYPDTLLPRPIGTLELVSDCTASMLERCRGAILQGKGAFRHAMERMLHRVCDLGFDRARFWIQNPDPRYLDGFACYPAKKHRVAIDKIRLDEETDYYLRKAKQESPQKGRVFEYRGTEGPQAPEVQSLRDPETPWIEVHLWSKEGENWTFVGKINLDNEPSRKSGRHPLGADLRRNKAFWPLLERYAEMLGEIVQEARQHWLHENRALQAKALRDLDLKLIQVASLDVKMRAIADCAQALLKPDHCHIRLRQGDVLTLTASAGGDLEWRVRDAVSTQADEAVSVSARFAASKLWNEPRIFTRDELRVMTQDLRGCGRHETAAQFDRLQSCGVFGFVDTEGCLIGVLVLDSEREHYFDQERISVAKDLVARAQILLEHSLARERLQNLVNSLASEVVVLDRNATVLLYNQAWDLRTSKVSSNPKLKSEGLSYSHVTRCSLRSASLFEKEVASVFEKREPTRMVATFEAPEGRTQHMAVILAPFERNALGRVETVLVVMSDITDLVSVECIIQGALPQPEVGLALAEPLKGILALFGAARASVAECVSFEAEDSAIRVRCRVDDPDVVGTISRQLPVISRTGELLLYLRTYGYLAVTDVDSSSALPSEAMRAMLRQDGFQSLLAAPIYLIGEPWGFLAVLFKHRRAFSGHDVHLLHAAAAQLSMLILLSQQAELRSMDRQIVEGISDVGSGGSKQMQRRDFLEKILRQAIRLTGCDGGHIRAADWDRGELVLQAAENDPLVHPDRPQVRDRVPLGEPVAGEVALSGKLVIKSHRSDFDPKDLPGIPSDRTDVMGALEKEQSFACVPLVSGNEIFGTATLTSNAPRFFEGHRRQLLGDFIQRASLALGAIRQTERLEEMSQEFGRVLNVGVLDALWPRISELARRLFLCEASSLSSFDPTTNKLRREAVAVVDGFDYQEEIGETTTASDEPGCGLSRWVAKVGGVHRLEGSAASSNLYLSSDRVQYHSRLPSGRFKSIMLARLDTPEGKPMGVLRVINRKGRLEDLGFTEFDEALMRLLSTKLAIAVERLKLIESRNRSIATIAHDLKTPLQNIRVTLEGLLEGVFRLPDDTEELVMSYNSCKLLDAFILSTIEVAQGKMDRARVQVEEIDARMLVNEAIEVLRPKFNDPRAKDNPWNVVTNVAPDAEKVWGDRQQLLRLLLNLCHNAWKHGRATKEGLENGTQQNKVEVTVRQDGDTCCLRVADRGPGRGDASQPQQATKSAVKDDPGQGVGLASGRLVAEAHNGDLVFGSRADGLPGFQVELTWNQMELRRSLALAQSINEKPAEQ
jgi:signal transduction histidine kinase/GAF domain-containing protein